MGMHSFRDSDLRGAIAQVRAALGAEALILSTRWGGGLVEVTASLDEPDDPPIRPAALPEAKRMSLTAMALAAQEIGAGSAWEAAASPARPHAPDHAAMPVPDQPGGQWADMPFGRATEPPDGHPSAASAAAPAADALWPSLDEPSEREDAEPAQVETGRQAWGGPPWAGAPTRATAGSGRTAPIDPARLEQARAAIGRADPVRFDLLTWHGVPPPLARRLRAGPLPFALSINLKFGRIDLSPGAAPIVVVGPPGAGKTLTIARLATRLVRAGERPVVVNADSIRAGATEQLGALTRLLGLQLIDACEPENMATALRERDRRAPVLVDTAGTNPFRAADAATISALGAPARAQLLAVLPAGLDPDEAADLAAGYAALGAAMMVATRIDLARRLGGILAAARAGLTLVEAGIGPGAADGLVPATPDLLARHLLAGRALAAAAGHGQMGTA